MLHEVSNILAPAQLQELKEFGARVRKYGANFAVFGPEIETILLCEGEAFQSDRDQLADYCRQVLSKREQADGTEDENVEVWRFGDENLVLAVVLESASIGARRSRPIGAALIDLGERPIGSASGGPMCRANSSGVCHDDEYWADALRLLVHCMETSVRADHQIEKIGTELSQTYEELVLLHKLSTNMRVTEEDASFLQMACDNLTDIVQVEGIAILLDKTVDGEQRLVLTAGSGVIDFDERIAALLHSRLVEEMGAGKEALLDSEVDSPFEYDWPENIRNIIAVPLCGKEKAESSLTGATQDDISIMGLMVAVNRVDKQDFDSIDVKLFNSVASSCAVFVENGRLFKDLKELFIGSLKALTNSIDAKDQYTRGHSERVALISRWIAERVAERQPLDEEQVHRVYLAGLLHDIGKIGIDEAVLRKQGKLSDEEREMIQDHPSIGAGILREIKQMRDIVPGVLCHHERMDGKGYPKGLTAKQIPLVGKIVGLADSFDAMTSKRTYRDARTVEQAVAEIKRGLGTQFDEDVATVFLESDVYQLWDMILGAPGFVGIAGTENVFAEYGTAAVGTLIR